ASTSPSSRCKHCLASDLRQDRGESGGVTAPPESPRSWSSPGNGRLGRRLLLQFVVELALAHRLGAFHADVLSLLGHLPLGQLTRHLAKVFGAALGEGVGELFAT